MRYPASEKLEIIRTVEGSHLPTKQTLDMLGIPRSTFYRWYDLYLEDGLDGLSDKSPSPKSVWNRIPDDRRDDLIEFALEHEALTARELAVKYTDEKRYYVSESSAYRILKEADLITAPDYVVIKAAEEFKDKTTAINQMWQTDFTYLKVQGWGWFYLSTIMDDYSRFIIHYELCNTMKTPDVQRSIEQALRKTGLPKGRRPKVLSDNGSCYISDDIKKFMKSKGIKQVHGAPNHPQTQGKIERYHRSMKNVVKLEHYYTVTDLKESIDAWVAYYNNHRYHESLNNCTPASVYAGKHHQIIKKRQLLKQQSMKQRRSNHMFNQITNFA